MPRSDRPGKRERLVTAAYQLLYEQGVERTTLAEIAELANVPAGNVYYYFKTKNELIAAVLDAQSGQIASTFAAIESHHPCPKERLKALVMLLAGHSEVIALYGSPLGPLCTELAKRGDGPDVAAAGLVRQILIWTEEQFTQIGEASDASDLALEFLAACEGIALLANVLRDLEIISTVTRRINQWIDAQ
jgi:AcrR family transcriptional regulator